MLTLHRLRVTSGIFFGVAAAARVTYMKDLMNTRRLITFHKVMKLLEKTDFASILSECKNDLVNSILILCLIHIYYPMNLENFMNTIKNLNSMIAKRIFGLLNRQTQHKVKVLCLLMILMMSMWMNCL